MVRGGLGGGLAWFRRGTRATTLLALCSVAAAAGQGKVELRLKLPGSLTYVNTTDMDMLISVGGGRAPMKIKTKQVMTLRLSISGSEASNYKVVSTVADSKTTSPEKGAVPLNLAEIDKSVVGSRTTATYDSRGNLIGTAKVQGQTSEMLGQLASSMGYFSSGFMGVLYPKDPVGSEASWMTSLDLGRLLSKALNGVARPTSERIPLRYKLLKFSRSGGKQLAHIQVTMKGTINMAPTAKQGQITGSSVKANIDSKGTVQVDTATGIPQSSTMNATTSMTVDGQPFSQKMAITVKRL